MNGFDTLPIHGEGRAFYEKPADFRWVDGEVLITVKATPQPSSKYGDTVCVAGIRMSSTGPEWVRLYPVPFRSLYETQQFQKYDVLRLRMKPSDKDFRAESFNPDLLSIKKIGHLKPWKQRHPWISPLTDRWTMCEILEKARAEGYKSYPSLAVIRPKDSETSR
ncbi:hypothetical protein [Auritidibacter ignavus]|uniref:hypothetical protein n=1 Tax=Auritidibacter ignavus TaxID=678932 RepID=UPI002FE5C466